MNRRLSLLASGALALAFWAGTAGAESLVVPNASFELPIVFPDYVSIDIDHWQKTATPAWYDESGPFIWAQLTGLFKNTPVGSFDHLDNCDGTHAIWLFALPEVGLFQDYDSVDYNDAAPTHAFNATFETGKSYALIVGVNGGGGGMAEGATMEMSLYYRDGTGARHTVGATTVTNTLANFPTHTHFTDYTVQIPVVKSGDAWLGKHIGVQFLSTVPFDAEEAGYGGYWDLDHVRLIAVPAPDLQCTPAGGSTRISWLSVPSYQYQVKVSPDLGTWTDYGTAMSGTGGELFTLYPRAGQDRAFFRIVVTPEP